MSDDREYRDEVGFINDKNQLITMDEREKNNDFKSIIFENVEEIEKYFNDITFIDAAITLYGEKIPLVFEVELKGEERKIFVNLVPFKDGSGLPMEWKFYTGQVDITEEDINNETNIEKRRGLMLEYGLTKYLQDSKVIQEDNYGTLMDVHFKGDGGDSITQRIAKVINGTNEYIKLNRLKQIYNNIQAKKYTLEQYNLSECDRYNAAIHQEKLLASQKHDLTPEQISQFLPDLEIPGDVGGLQPLIFENLKDLEEQLRVEKKRLTKLETAQMLTKEGHKIYYLFVPSEMQRCKEAVAWSWNTKEEYLPDEGFTWES